MSDTKTKQSAKKAGDRKLVVCKECGHKFYAVLKLGDREFLDGYHGECPGNFCGYWHFEKV